MGFSLLIGKEVHVMTVLSPTLTQCRDFHELCSHYKLNGLNLDFSPCL